jgi:sialic acid synthase SpsE/quercetin dioxygenase-like cupin family protein
VNSKLKNLYIFEMANNHQGDESHARRIIETMAGIAQRHRINAAVKFQYRDLDTFIHPDYVNRPETKHIPRFLSTRLARKQFGELVRFVRDAGLTAVVTPFDERSVELALEHHVDVLKVASCSANDWPLLEVIASAGLPMVCSTGGCDRRDIDRLVTFLEHRGVRDVALLHCVGLYPAPPESIQMAWVRRMIHRYKGIPIGYSGHEEPNDVEVVRAAVAMGATILERHVGIETDDWKLNAYSLGPEQAERWVAAAESTRRLCGADGAEKVVTEKEKTSLRELARGVFASRNILAGERIERSSVFFAMPCVDATQTTSGEFLDEMVASREYSAGEAIRERRPVTPVNLVREYVHQAKGLLKEASIHIGSSYSIELSHHYGLERFAETGTIIVNLVNRAYCKKLLVLLPGQRHPAHLHKQKDETFQVLYGSLDLVIEGQSHSMVAGDLQTILPGQRHEFRTSSGCIVEEISTTHILDDSVYVDPVLARKDPIERKTFLESW